MAVMNAGKGGLAHGVRGPGGRGRPPQRPATRAVAAAAGTLSGPTRRRNIFLFSWGWGFSFSGSWSFANAGVRNQRCDRADELLLRHILPEEVANELKVKGHADAKHFDDVTILFTDFKGRTRRRRHAPLH